MNIFQIRKSDDAVSPVIGVMLMIVVTIIVAAVIALFASGVIGGNTAAPTASFDVKATNTSLTMKLVSTSDKIPSKYLTIAITSNGSTVLIEPKNYADKATNPEHDQADNRTPFGFHIAETVNASGFLDSANRTLADDKTKFGGYYATINQAANRSNFNQWFGNYTLQAGSVMSASGPAFKDMIPQAPTGLNNKTTWNKSSFLKEASASKELWLSVFPSAPLKDKDGEKLNINVTKYKNYIGFQLDTDDKNLGVYYEKIRNYYEPALEKGGLYMFGASDYSGWDFSKSKDDPENGKITYQPNQNQANNIYGEKQYLKAGQTITVTITHTPSNKILYSETIVVQADD